MTLQIAYFPPIEYFAVLARYSSVYVEAFENYQKQSYRNRFRFYAENGMQELNFPVRHVRGSQNVPIRSIEVDYSTPWVEKTLRCLDTAYRSSAYYDYYRDELASLLLSKPARLWDLDMGIMRFLMRRIGLATEIIESSEFTGEALDIHPKHPAPGILSGYRSDRPYYQVFSDRHGFIGGLSVADLLFNEGPGALDYLRQGWDFTNNCLSLQM